MGLIITKFMASFSKKPTRLLMLGLDAAGKTTLLYKMKLGEYLSTVPTIGFNVETVHYKNLHMTIWDIGGQTQIRKLWRHYYAGTDALIFVVDSSDIERLELARDELFNVLDEEELKDAKVLIYANKMDISTLQLSEIAERLGLSKLKREWKIQATCAMTGEGIYEGLDWLSKTMKN